MNFGELIKDLRIAKELTLRQCCAELEVDPSNWSKMERGIHPAPKDTGVLEQWASFFKLEANERQVFFDAAALSRRELPSDLATDGLLLQALPAFFRAVRSNEMDQAKMEQFIQDLKALHSPDKETAE